MLKISLSIAPFLGVLVAWVLTNRKEPEIALLSKRAGRFVFAMGVLFFIGGVALADAGVFGPEIPESRRFGFEWKFVGIAFWAYGVYGRKYRLVPVLR